MVKSASELEKILQSRWAYNPTRAASSAKKLLNMEPDLYLAFEKYIETDQFSNEPVFFGISPLDISQNYPFKPPAVFLTLDWISRDPQNALDALVEEYKKPLPRSFIPQEFQEFMNDQKNII